jgi:hypothetical protein
VAMTDKDHGESIRLMREIGDKFNQILHGGLKFEPLEAKIEPGMCVGCELNAPGKCPGPATPAAKSAPKTVEFDIMGQVNMIETTDGAGRNTSIYLRNEHKWNVAGRVKSVKLVVEVE